jgi:hypothetical protein
LIWGRLLIVIPNHLSDRRHPFFLSRHDHRIGYFVDANRQRAGKRRLDLFRLFLVILWTAADATIDAD